MFFVKLWIRAYEMSALISRGFLLAYVQFFNVLTIHIGYLTIKTVILVTSLKFVTRREQPIALMKTNRLG
jgi:hypothetical protein